MNLSVSMPIDSQGFLRRECPRCEQQFKWHHGPANEEAEGQPPPPTYYCPLCGEPADVDSWWTQEQIEYARGVATPAAMRFIHDELAAAFRGSKYLKFKAGSGGDIPDVPASLTEPDDMCIVASPCHGYEPIKVPEDAQGPFHCLVCGEPFAV